MNLLDALESIKPPIEVRAPALAVGLGCGFTPLHLATFLSAHLRQRLPARNIEMKTGIYGDLKGSLLLLESSKCSSIAVAIEWQDLDKRLGVRNLGGWRTTDIPDIVASAKQEMERVAGIIKSLARSIPTAVSLPTLPLPPLFSTTPENSCGLELCLRQHLASFAASIGNEPGVRMVSPQAVDERSPIAQRLDVKSEVLFGFPYKIAHASVVAECLAALLEAPVPKKGIITDLDDTLWAGLLGEVGKDGVAWDLDRSAHIHGLYQQFLASLASSGTLLAAASKNDPGLVEQVLEREDILLSKQFVFPVVARWGPKSESVREILRVWNVGAESVVFIDDSPMETAEVKAAFPELECLIFPKTDYQALWKLMWLLREKCGKSVVSEEDTLRLKSIREASNFRESLALSGRTSDEFLQALNASVVFDRSEHADDRRAFELINKTNQFNLNGKRVSEAAWQTIVNDPSRVLITVGYHDKFGALGKIAVLVGTMESGCFRMDHWVLSCRAFSRHIEYQCLKFVFENCSVARIAFAYQATSRNSFFQEFLSGLLGEKPGTEPVLAADEFLNRCPPLFHQVSVHERNG